MKIAILYDNNARDGFQSGHGFSALIDGHTLFDTGGNPAILLDNMKALNVQMDKIEHVIISHTDWDHIGGIQILDLLGAVHVYLPYGTPESVKHTITSISPNVSISEILHLTDIGSNKFITPTLGTEKKEISLAIDTMNGLVLVTGCAHPGLDVIMHELRDLAPIRAIIGGFHDFDKLKTLAGIEYIVPCHCTKKKDSIMGMYRDKTHFAGAGTIIQIRDKA